VAEFIKSALRDDSRLCVVVSAMGHTTNDLIALAYQVCNDPPKRELDMLISCGERSSMALLAMALDDVGIKAISLTGSQSGIITNDHHMGAEIIAVKPTRVQEAFLTHQVVIIAGFQGVSEKKEITTLKRGGSDTTAVAMAAALNADCEIYTDVEGVMDIDPKLATMPPQMFTRISFERMEAMALYGARVMAHDAITLAKALNVTIRVGQTGDDAPALLTKEPEISFTHLRAVIQFCVDRDSVANLVNRFGYFLCGSFRDGHFVGYVSNDIAEEMININSHQVIPGLAMITIHLAKNQQALLALSKIAALCKRHDLALVDLLLGHNEIFVVVEDGQLSGILASLHAELRTAAI